MGRDKGGKQVSKQSSGRRRYNEVVEALVADPAQPPNLRALVGLLGRSAKKGHTRLYVTMDLCDYLDIPDEAIVHSVATDTRSSPLGANVVWIDRDSKILRTRVQTRAEDKDGWDKIYDLGANIPNSDCKYVVDKVHL